MVFTFTKGNYERFFYEPYRLPHILNQSQCGSPGGMVNIEKILNLVPSSLKHVWCNH